MHYREGPKHAQIESPRWKWNYQPDWVIIKILDTIKDRDVMKRDKPDQELIIMK